MEKGCGKEVVETGSVTMNKKMPFALVVGYNVVPGLKEEFCIQCQNGY
jgi:hypothetical protein